MPEHVHLLVSEPEMSTLAQAIKSLKQGVSRRLIGKAEHFWQTRYYDHNVRNYEGFVDKLKYIHRNPVTRGLCGRPEERAWSSFRHYATGVEGVVDRIAMAGKQTGEGRRLAAGIFSAPLKPKAGLNGPPRPLPGPPAGSYTQAEVLTHELLHSALNNISDEGLATFLTGQQPSGATDWQRWQSAESLIHGALSGCFQ